MFRKLCQFINNKQASLRDEFLGIENTIAYQPVYGCVLRIIFFFHFSFHFHSNIPHHLIHEIQQLNGCRCIHSKNGFYLARNTSFLWSFMKGFISHFLGKQQRQQQQQRQRQMHSYLYSYLCSYKNEIKMFNSFKQIAFKSSFVILRSQFNSP